MPIFDVVTLFYIKIVMRVRDGVWTFWESWWRASDLFFFDLDDNLINVSDALPTPTRATSSKSLAVTGYFGRGFEIKGLRPRANECD